MQKRILIYLITLLIIFANAVSHADEVYALRMYFGLSIPTGGGVSLAQWNAFEKDEIAKVFEGFVVVDSIGYYKGQPELSKIITLILKAEDIPKAEALAKLYAKKFHQDSVMTVKEKVLDWRFIGQDDQIAENDYQVDHAAPIQPFHASKVIDLTHVLHKDMAYWPGGVPFKKEVLVSYESGGYLLHKFEFGENTGTHVDAPAHFIKGNLTIDQLTLEQLILPMVVIDIQAKTAQNPDYSLTQEDILHWEASHGLIPAKSLVVLNTGWHKKFANPDKYINQDADKVMHFPGFTSNAAALLVNRNVSGIGIDTLSIDPGASMHFEAHVVMLSANKLQIENMANLDALPAKGATATIGVLPIKDGSQAQARILALLP